MQIELNNIDFSRNNQTILKNFNLQINKGDKILLKGRSGSGKSTVFKLILGFQKPDKGKIFIDGEPLSENNIFEVRKNISYVDQDVSILNGKIRDTIMEIESISDSKILSEDFNEYLELFELEENILDKELSEISGGEKQRIGLTIGLCLNRDILMVDEVISSLDNTLKKKVLNLIINLDKSVIATGHDGEWEDFNFKEVEIERS